MDKEHFKECAPEETVAKLKSILSEMGIETEERAVLTSSIGTHSMRVIFKGSNFGTNGKGVSGNYCSASAYAELFERYQNDLMIAWKNTRSEKYGFYRVFDERIMTTPEIVTEMNSFMQFYFKKRGLEQATFEEKVDAFNRVQRMDYWLYQLDGQYVTVPFYSVKNDSVVNMPYNTYSAYYGSNGMCAGNTYAEALVQGLSEIFERVAQRRIFIEKPTLPDIPESYIKKFPLIDRLYTNLKKNPHYSYYLKDCSFGGLYPVAALIVVDKNTGQFGIKLGCHPNYGIAMERCFTEAAQGRDVYDYSHSSSVDFYDVDVDADYNICNSMKIGNARWPYELFGKDSTYEFVEAEDVASYDNETLLKRLMKKLLDEGHDVLIRNVSYLGFPSFHIIIPGFSELQDADDKRFRANQTKLYVQTLLSDPATLTAENIKYPLAIFDYFKNVLTENTMSEFYPRVLSFEYPAQEIMQDMTYMRSMCYAFSGNYESAASLMCRIYDVSVRANNDEGKSAFYHAMYHYFTAMRVMNNHNKAMEYLSVFYDATICEQIGKIVASKLSLFTEQYPRSEQWATLEDSAFKVIHENRSKLFDRQVASGITQVDLRQLFL